MDMTETDWRLPETFDFGGQEIRWGSQGEGAPRARSWNALLLHRLAADRAMARSPPAGLLFRSPGLWTIGGYGQSEMRAGQDVSLGVQNEVLAALLDHWRIERPDVVAHDFGGATALRTHLLNGRDYRTLTLIDPVAIGPSGSALVQAAKNHEAVFAGLPAYIHEAILRAYLGGTVFHALREDEMALYMKHGSARKDKQRSIARSPR